MPINYFAWNAQTSPGYLDFRDNIDWVSGARKTFISVNGFGGSAMLSVAALVAAAAEWLVRLPLRVRLDGDTGHNQEHR